MRFFFIDNRSIFSGKHKALYPPSLSKVGPFTLESHIALKASKCKSSAKNRCLIKPLFKNSSQTMFQGSTPWVTQNLSNVIVWMVLYCAHKLLGGKKSQPFIHLLWVKLVHWLFHDISIGLLCYFYGITMWFTMDFYEISLRCLWYFHEITMGFLLDSFGIPMIFSMLFFTGFLWDFDRISMEVLWKFCCISKGCLWDLHWIPMGSIWYFVWYFKGISMGLVWDLEWDSYGISMGVLWDSFGIPEGFPWYVYGLL